MTHEMHRRTHYLVKKHFQLKYTLVITIAILTVMFVSGIGIYVGMWSSIIENFSEFKVSENLETARRIAGYEDARYGKGDFRLEKIFREAELLSAQEQDILHSALKSVNRALLPKMIILVAVIFIGSIFVSHRIAGPMYRLEKSALAVRDGDLRVKFNVRKTDEMKDVAVDLEKMVESLHDDIEKIKKLNHDPEIAKILSKYKT
jgi:methyl-accepting chemotaxis protein